MSCLACGPLIYIVDQSEHLKSIQTKAIRILERDLSDQEAHRTGASAVPQREDVARLLSENTNFIVLVPEPIGGSAMV